MFLFEYLGLNVLSVKSHLEKFTQNLFFKCLIFHR